MGRLGLEWWLASYGEDVMALKTDEDDAAMGTTDLCSARDPIWWVD